MDSSPMREADSLTPSSEPALLPPCPLVALPVELHNYIHGLEQRIVEIETKQARFENAIMGLGRFINDSPQGKMILMALPKAAQEKLKAVFPNGA